MAMVSLSLDTDSRQVVLLVDGEVKPMAEVHLAYFFDFDGAKVIRFEYSMDVANEDGLMEKRIFILPDKDQMNLPVDSTGMILRKAVDSPEIAKDIHKYLERK